MFYEIVERYEQGRPLRSRQLDLQSFFKPLNPLRSSKWKSRSREEILQEELAQQCVEAADIEEE